MKTKHFITIAAAMLLMLASLATKAQDVYEYATVSTWGLDYHVSFSNGEFKKVTVDKTTITGGGDWNQTGVLKYIATLSKEGWEVIGFTSGGVNDAAWKYMLRRKVK